MRWTSSSDRSRSRLDADSQSPLHRAAEAGEHGVVDVLLLQEADTDARERYASDTPLHLAAAEGHALCVSLLVVSGADNDAMKTTVKLHFAWQRETIDSGQSKSSCLLMQTSTFV